MARIKKVIQQRLDPNVTHKRVNAILAMQRQNDIISMLLEGKDPKKDIVPYVASKYNMKRSSAENCVTDARNMIKQRNKYEVGNLVSLHINRYEEIYKLLYEVNAPQVAMQALQAKEKLLGFHREGFHMKVTKGEITAVQLQTVDSDYNVMKLSKEKQDRLTMLLNKARRDEGKGGSDAGN